jgi:hypothetical protein
MKPAFREGNERRNEAVTRAIPHHPASAGPCAATGGDVAGCQRPALEQRLVRPKARKRSNLELTTAAVAPALVLLLERGHEKPQPAEGCEYHPVDEEVVLRGRDGVGRRMWATS